MVKVHDPIRSESGQELRASGQLLGSGHACPLKLIMTVTRQSAPLSYLILSRSGRCMTRLALP